MSASYDQMQQNPDDLRFQFEIIKGLGDSVRQQTAAMAEMQRVQIEIVERLARIEAKDHGVALAALRAEVDTLKEDKLRRDGANGIIHAILRSPVIGWIVAAGGGIYYMLRDSN